MPSKETRKKLDSQLAQQDLSSVRGRMSGQQQGERYLAAARYAQEQQTIRGDKFSSSSKITKETEPQNPLIPIRVQRDYFPMRDNQARLPLGNLYHVTQVGINRKRSWRPEDGTQSELDSHSSKGHASRRRKETWTIFEDGDPDSPLKGPDSPSSSATNSDRRGTKQPTKTDSHPAKQRPPLRDITHQCSNSNQVVADLEALIRKQVKEMRNSGCETLDKLKEKKSGGDLTDTENPMGNKISAEERRISENAAELYGQIPEALRNARIVEARLFRWPLSNNTLELQAQRLFQEQFMSDMSISIEEARRQVWQENLQQRQQPPQEAPHRYPRQQQRPLAGPSSYQPPTDRSTTGYGVQNLGAQGVDNSQQQYYGGPLQGKPSAFSGVPQGYQRHDNPLQPPRASYGDSELQQSQETQPAGSLQGTGYDTQRPGGSSAYSAFKARSSRRDHLQISDRNTEQLLNARHHMQNINDNMSQFIGNLDEHTKNIQSSSTYIIDNTKSYQDSFHLIYCILRDELEPTAKMLENCIDVVKKIKATIKDLENSNRAYQEELNKQGQQYTTFKQIQASLPSTLQNNINDVIEYHATIKAELEKHKEAYKNTISNANDQIADKHILMHAQQLDKRLSDSDLKSAEDILVECKEKEFFRQQAESLQEEAGSLQEEAGSFLTRSYLEFEPGQLLQAWGDSPERNSPAAQSGGGSSSWKNNK